MVVEREPELRATKRGFSDEMPIAELSRVRIILNGTYVCTDNMPEKRGREVEKFHIEIAEVYDA